MVIIIIATGRIPIIFQRNATIIVKFQLDAIRPTFLIMVRHFTGILFGEPRAIKSRFSPIMVRGGIFRKTRAIIIMSGPITCSHAPIIIGV